MCTACAKSGACRVLTPKHRHPLLQTYHDELWHCDVCHCDQEFLPTVAAAVLATTVTSLPTAKPAVVAQMPDASAKAVAAVAAVAVAAAAPGARPDARPAYRCDVGCDFDLCEDCFANPKLEVRKGRQAITLTPTPTLSRCARAASHSSPRQRRREAGCR